MLTRDRQGGFPEDLEDSVGVLLLIFGRVLNENVVENLDVADKNKGLAEWRVKTKDAVVLLQVRATLAQYESEIVPWQCSYL